MRDPHCGVTPDMATTSSRRRRPTANLPRPVVIGMGPCGLFAGLILAQMGFRPIILERGKAVRERTKDTWGLWRKGVLNPESNVQFGEGGAGTFSDGKLYSQIKDPRHLRPQGADRVRQGRRAGGDPLRQQAAHRHLPAGDDGREHARDDRGAGRRDPLRAAASTTSMIERRRASVRGVTCWPSGETHRAPTMSCSRSATARATPSQMLHERGVYIEAKPFSIGFRIEHPQSLIDRARFGPHAGHPLLGAADYKLVHHASNGRSVYSFCMCPGGTVVAATSEPGRVVTNGMSQYSRNERNANAGIVVGITPAATIPARPAGRHRASSASWESRAFALGGGNYDAPGQLVGDFLAGRPSTRARRGAAVLHSRACA